MAGVDVYIDHRSDDMRGESSTAPADKKRQITRKEKTSMKFMKKLAGMALAFVMVMSMSVPVMAANITVEGGGGQRRVQGLPSP